MPVIKSEFRAAWWLTNPHAQTLWPRAFRKKPKLKLQWQRVELDDGDFIDLTWSGPEEGKTVLILHGLEGSIDSPYAVGLMDELSQRGYRSCLMHFRGCSRDSNRLPQSYHSGKTEDPQLILEYLQKQMDIQVYGAIGFSLGGNVLLKWLGEQGTNSPLQKAAVMSVPFQLRQAAIRMNQGFSRIYQRYLVNELRNSYRNKFAIIPSSLNIDLETLNTFFLFDDQVTAPLHGFNGVDDYYSQASSRQFIPGIYVPTLILHAADDPFMFAETAPLAEELPENVWLEMTPQGGHVGFISGDIPGRAHYWGEQRLVDWIDDQ
ncbi:MAG: hydrolase [Proteobacteria bacterium]|nr:hydrolase [Pseudomonadota bacterium]